MIKIVGKSWRRRVVGKGSAGQLGAFSMGLLEKRRGELKFFFRAYLLVTNFLFMLY